MKYLITGRKRSDARRKLKVLIDDDLYKYLNQFYWQVDAFNTVKGRVDGRQVLIHHLILPPQDGLEVDHIDGNRLNNQRSNLRLVNSSQNKINRGPRKDNKSGYKGVSLHKQTQRWSARIMVGGKYLSLGLHNSAKNAARAYNQAATKYYKQYAWLNSI